MNRALSIIASAEARPLRWVIALIDQAYRKVAQVGVGGLTPPENVHTYERTDTETGEVVLAYDWMAFRLDIVGDDKFQLYTTAIDTFDVSGETDDLTEATKFQVKTLLYRCREDAGDPATSYWANERGTRFSIDPVEGQPVKVRLKLGTKKGITILQAVALNAGEIGHLSVNNSDHIYDGIHRGYAQVVAKLAGVPAIFDDGKPQITPDVAPAAPVETAPVAQPA